jgi:molybdopterin-guanine dinucleotide biosynthesis protein A
MGSSKADLIVNGLPMGLRLCRTLESAGFDICVLGRPVPGFPFVEDVEPGAGPLSALSHASIPHEAEAVFVTSCDAILLTGEDARRLTALLASSDREAVVPRIDGSPQPLCAAYRAAAFDVAKELVSRGETRVRTWTESLRTGYLDEAALIAQELDPEHFCSANTPEEFARLSRLLVEKVVDGPVGRPDELDEFEGHSASNGA